MKRFFVSGARVITDAANHTLKCAVTETHGSAPDLSAESAVSPESTGLCPLSKSGRLAQFQVDIAAGETWSHVIGLEPDAQPDGDA